MPVRDAIASLLPSHKNAQRFAFLFGRVSGCTFLSSLICTDRQIILVKLALCGSFRVGKIKFTKKIKLGNWTFSGLYGQIEICRISVRYAPFLSCTDNLIISEQSSSANFQKNLKRGRKNFLQDGSKNCKETGQYRKEEHVLKSLLVNNFK